MNIARVLTCSVRLLVQERKAEALGGPGELLNSFNVATFKNEEDDASFWERLIPTSERPPPPEEVQARACRPVQTEGCNGALHYFVRLHRTFENHSSTVLLTSFPLSETSHCIQWSSRFCQCRSTIQSLLCADCRNICANNQELVCRRSWEYEQLG